MRLIRSSAVRRGAFFAALLVAAACDNNNEPSTPATIVGVPGQSVAGRAGEAVPITVRVAASNGRTLEGQTVTFAVGGGGGSVNPASAVTDAAGQAQTVWTLGPTVGTQTLNATVASVTPLTISATVTAGRPAKIEISAGNNQTASVGQTVAVRPAVRVLDAGNNPVPNASVVYQVTSGGGTILGGVTTTDAAGIATVGSWQLGSTAGPNTLTAQVVDPNATTALLATFTATGTAGQASRITGRQGVNISAPVGSTLSGTNLPSVLVTDANNNPVANVAVTFTVTSGGGQIVGGTQTTNAQGIATVGGFTVGNTVGNNLVTATAPNAGSTLFTIVGTAGPAATVQVVGGNNQEAPAGSALPAAPTVRVVDSFGNPVQGATVTFAATTAGTSVLGGTQQTNAQGVAAAGGVNLAATPGTNTVTATVQGLTPVTFTFTGLAGAPATVTPIQTDTIRVQAFATSAAMTVLVRDAAGFAVRGATVTFTVDSAKAGTLNPASAVTDAQGQATTRLVAGSVIDTATVTASVNGTPGATFTVVVALNAPANVRQIQGNGQSATAGTQVAVPPTVEVRDASGNPVVGVDVFFAIVSGTSNPGGGLYPPAGSVLSGSGVLVPTDATGRASVGWQLGGTPNADNVLTVVVQAPNVAGNPITFTARGTAAPGAGTTISIVQGDAQTTTAGNLVPVPPAVIVKNAAGTPLSGVSVEFLPSLGSQVNGSTTSVVLQTNAGGVAQLTSWRLSTTPGLNTLTISVVGAGVTTTVTATGQ